MKDPPRIDVLRQGRAEVARQAQAAPTKPTQKSWAARHKKGLIITAVLATIGVMFVVFVPQP